MESRASHRHDDSRGGRLSSAATSRSMSSAAVQLESDGVEALRQRIEHERSLSATGMRSVLALVAARLADHEPAGAAAAEPRCAESCGSAVSADLAPLPFLLPELQRIVAEYAAPPRMFVGVSPAEEEEQQQGAVEGSWRVERLHSDQLRRLLLQRRLDRLRVAADAAAEAAGGDAAMLDLEAEEAQVDELQARSLDQLLDECRGAQADPDAAAAAAPPLLPPHPLPPPIPPPQPQPPVHPVHAAAAPHAPHIGWAAVMGNDIGDEDDELDAEEPAAHHLLVHWPNVAAAAAVPVAAAAAPPAVAVMAPAAAAAAPVAAAAPAQTATPVYPDLPFEYLIEVAGADRIYCRHADAEVDKHMQRLRLEEEAERQRQPRTMQQAGVQQLQQGAPPSSSSRSVHHCHLLPYLRLLFVDAHQQAGLPQLPSSVLSLVGAYASEPAPYSLPSVFSFDRAGSQLPLRIEREDEFRLRLWPHISRYQQRHEAAMAERLFGTAADALSQCDDAEWRMDDDEDGRESTKEGKQQPILGVRAPSPRPLRARAARRQRCLSALWTEQRAHERRSSDFVQFLRSTATPGVPAHFVWLLRGGAFDHIARWQQVTEPPPQ